MPFKEKYIPRGFYFWIAIIGMPMNIFRNAIIGRPQGARPYCQGLVPVRFASVRFLSPNYFPAGDGAGGGYIH